jgi:hypothetical protein
MSLAQQCGLLSELPPESAVLARPEAVLVTANVLRLRLAGYGSVEGVSADLPSMFFQCEGRIRAEATRNSPPSTLVPCEGCISRGLLFNPRGASERWSTPAALPWNGYRANRSYSTIFI